MALFERLRLLFRVSRPLYWSILPSVYIAGIMYSGNHPRFAPTTLIAFALSFPSCLITFGVNDVYDYQSDKQNSRKRNQWIDGGVLNPLNHDFILQASRISTVLVLLFAIPATQISPLVLPCIITLLFLAWTYSSPPLRLKEWPIVDSLSNGAVLGLAWACGYMCNGHLLLSQSSSKAVIGVWFVAFYGSACHGLGAIADVNPDTLAKHRTTATVLGERVAAICAALYFFLAWEMVDRWSDVSIAAFAGIMTSLVLVIAPFLAPTFARLAITASILGTMVWTVKTFTGVEKWQDVLGKWREY